jgi:hypothetical protein
MPQPSHSARPLPSVLPSIENSVGHPPWAHPPHPPHPSQPPRYYQYPLPNMLPAYTPYSQPQFQPPPPPHGGFPHPRHDTAPPAENRMPNPPYGYDVTRGPPHLHNGPHLPQPQGERRP